MFSFARIREFCRKILTVALPFVLAVFGLAVLTETLTHIAELPDYLLEPEFWLAVGLDMLPAMIATVAVFWLAGRFVSRVHGLGSSREAIGFLIRSRFGSPGFGPWMKVNGGKITVNEDSILTRIGGPGSLIIENDSAVLLEQNGRFTRVVGSGFSSLERFEQIYDIVDLQPKRCTPYTVSAMTKEGIPVSWDVEVRYQIADGGQASTPSIPYPLSKQDVFLAATSKWQREAGYHHGQDLDWEGLIVVFQAEGALRSILAQRSLDQLIGLTAAGERTARESIQEEVKQELSRIVPELGAKILEVKLHNLQVRDDAITKEWVRAWRTRWQSRTEFEIASKQADRIYEYETAKAEAQLWLLGDICGAFQRLEDNQTVIPTVVLMRLFSVLEKAGFSTTSRVFIPGEALKALEQMKQLVVGAPDQKEQSESDRGKGPDSTDTKLAVPGP